MLGRGLLANPALAQELSGGERLTREALRTFHERLYQAYAAHHPANVVLGRMRETMKYISCCFEDAAKLRKAMRKAKTTEAYRDAADKLLAMPLREEKSRDITLPTKVHLVKAMVFPVVMYGCESWTVKKAER